MQESLKKYTIDFGSFLTFLTSFFAHSGQHNKFMYRNLLGENFVIELNICVFISSWGATSWTALSVMNIAPKQIWIECRKFD